ncbi:hypothetical protein, partial [Micromonospora sp. MP36]|uniref:hypothetical protein n=1 Tax=Micromonospora sp. MP36 TaxID=2604468 RepID=UPI001CA31278
MPAAGRVIVIFSRLRRPALRDPVIGSVRAGETGGVELLIGRNPDEASTLPYLLKGLWGDGLV